MVPDIAAKPGTRTHGLLAYLYGPGKRDEHKDPHIVAAWQDGLAPDPGRDPKATLAQLAERLDLPVTALDPDRRPSAHVWHCPVRTSPGDRLLTDEEWAQVARRIVHATNIAPIGDDQACRWIAVRHADDHIHIVATLVRQDGRRPRRHNERVNAQAECRKIEAEFGLRVLNAGDGTAARRPTSAEQFKAERRGQETTSRELLREAVRRALAGAADEDAFFRRLGDAGLRVEKRTAPSGDVTGYTVSLPGDRNAAGKPIRFGGGRLATDLSLPRIRARLANGGTDDPPAGPQPARPRPARIRREATLVVEDTLLVLTEGDDNVAAAHLEDVGALLDALSETSAADTYAQLRSAAAHFERASRSHIRAARADHQALRHIAHDVIHAGTTTGRGEEGGATAMVLCTLVAVAMAAARWHSARGHAQQAAAARVSAEHLRAAYVAAAARPMRAMRTAGRALPAQARQHHAATLEAVLPEAVARLLDDAARAALSVTLDQALHAGHDAHALLRKAVDERELSTADDVAGVLIWRLRRLGNLPTTVRHRRHPAPSRTTTANTAQTPAIENEGLETRRHPTRR